MLKNIKYIILFFATEIKDSIIKYKSIILFSFIIRSKKHANFLKYLKLNENYWKKFDKKLNPKSKVLITDFVSIPGYSVTNAILGKFVSNIENLFPCGFVSDRNMSGAMIIKSFGAKNIFRLRRGSILNRLKFFIKSVKILNKINDIDEFIKFKYEKTNIGMAVYDHIIRFTGMGSINKISFKFYYFLSLALSIDEYCKSLFKNNSIQAVIIGELKWLPSSIIFENALVSNSKVYVYGGGTQKIRVRIYSNISERFIHKVKFSEKLFNFVLKNMKETALEESRKISLIKYKTELSQSDLFQSPKLFDQHLRPTSKKTISKKEISNIYGWDDQKPIIGIFNHSFIDGVFEVEWKVFRDHLTWLRRTLKFIRDVKSVNWIIKEHPYAYKENYYSPNVGAKTNAEKELNQIAADCKHIALFDKKFSSSTLTNCLDAVVTCQGSIGLEYPCLGVPAILASDCYFSGFGFTNEPRTEAEYFSHLENIKNLEKYKLSKEQIDKANIYSYITYILSLVEVPLLPDFKEKDSGDELFWFRMIDNIKNHNYADDYLYKMIKKQIKEKNRHTFDFDLLKSYSQKSTFVL